MHLNFDKACFKNVLKYFNLVTSMHDTNLCRFCMLEEMKKAPDTKKLRATQTEC